MAAVDDTDDDEVDDGVAVVFGKMVVVPLMILMVWMPTPPPSSSVTVSVDPGVVNVVEPELVPVTGPDEPDGEVELVVDSRLTKSSCVCLFVRWPVTMVYEGVELM